MELQTKRRIYIPAGQETACASIRHEVLLLRGEKTSSRDSDSPTHERGVGDSVNAPNRGAEALLRVSCHQ